METEKRATPLIIGDVKPEKMIEDYVNANQSSLRSLLRDMSSRKMEKPVID